MYLNRQNKERVVALLIQNAVFNQFLEQEEKMKGMFGKEGWKFLKMSRTFLLKSMDQLAQNLGKEEVHKLHNVAKHSDFMVVSKYTPKNSVIATIGVEVDALYDLAEIAIKKECTGCQKCDFKSCTVFQILRKTDIPAAQEVKNDCPYRQ